MNLLDVILIIWVFICAIVGAFGIGFILGRYTKTKEEPTNDVIQIDGRKYPV